MEYLDRLLARGERYPELARPGLEAAISAALRRRACRPSPPGPAGPSPPPSWPEATAEAGRVGRAGEVMFGRRAVRPCSAPAPGRCWCARRLSAAGRGRGAGRAARPYRRMRSGGSCSPSSPAASWPCIAGRRANCTAGGAASLGGQLAHAHRAGRPARLSPPRASAVHLEAAYHQRRADEIERGRRRRGPSGPAAADGEAGALAVLSAVLAAKAGHELCLPHLASAGQAPASGLASSAPVNSATAARERPPPGWPARSAGPPSSPAIRPCAPRWPSAASTPGTCWCSAGRRRPARLRRGARDGERCAACSAARLAGVYVPEVTASSGPARRGSTSASSRRTGRPRTGGRSRPTGGPPGGRPRAAAPSRLAASPGPRRARGRPGRRAPADHPGRAGPSQPVQVTGFGAPPPGLVPACRCAPPS